MCDNKDEKRFREFTSQEQDIQTAVLYRPGEEPDRIHQRLDRLFAKLDEAYPDKVIVGLNKDHRKWGEAVTELYRQLGYPDSNSFLAAYGYTLESRASGRPSGDPMLVIDELKRRYPNGSGFCKIDDLKAANPDLAAKFSNLRNQAEKFFGMTFSKYLVQEGILAGKCEKDADPCGDEFEVLKLRYAEKPFSGTLLELKNVNSDINWSAVSRYHSRSGSNDTFKVFLAKQGILFSAEEKLAEVTEELKKRYPDYKKFSGTYKALESENKDLPIGNLNALTMKVHKESARDYLVRVGIMEAQKSIWETQKNATPDETADIMESPKYVEDKLTAVIETLKERYASGDREAYSITDLQEQNPDLPIAAIDTWCNKVFNKNAIDYLTEQGILNGNFLIIDGVLKKCKLDRNTTTEIRIPDGVKRIAEHAFSELINRKKWEHYENVERIIFPDSLECIDGFAFCNMKKLGKVCLPPKINKMEHYAFYECDCEELIIPGSIKKVEWIFFSKRLKKVTVQEGVRELESCFSFSSLEEIVLPKTVKRIGHETFSFCDKLKRVIIQSSRCEIDENAFYPVWASKDDIDKLSVQVVCSPEVLAKTPKALKHLCVINTTGNHIPVYLQMKDFDIAAFISAYLPNWNVRNTACPNSKKKTLKVNGADVEVKCKLSGILKIKNDLFDSEGEGDDEIYSRRDLFDFLTAQENTLSKEEVSELIIKEDPTMTSDASSYAQSQIKSGTPTLDGKTGIMRFAFLLAIAEKLTDDEVLLAIANAMPRKKNGMFAQNQLLRIACAGIIYDYSNYFGGYENIYHIPQIYAKADSETSFTIAVADRAASPEELDLFCYDFVSTHPELFDIEKYMKRAKNSIDEPGT